MHTTMWLIDALAIVIVDGADTVIMEEVGDVLPEILYSFYGSYISLVSGHERPSSLSQNDENEGGRRKGLWSGASSGSVHPYQQPKRGKSNRPLT